MPCASRSHPLAIAIAISMTRPGTRPTRPGPPSLQFWLLLQLQDHNFSSSVAKERLSNSFAFDSFVRKQASVGESKKRKKNAGWFFAGGSFATFELCCVRPWQLTVGEIEEWGVLCVCLETERIVSGLEQCELNRNEKTNKEKNETTWSGFSKEQLHTPKSTCPGSAKTEDIRRAKGGFWRLGPHLMLCQFWQAGGFGAMAERVMAITKTSNFQSEQMCFKTVFFAGRD